MNSNVKILKLLNGQEIIAEITKDDRSEFHVEVKNPLLLMIVPSKENPREPTLGLMPWSHYSQQKVFEINRLTIITVMEPVIELINEYKRIQTGIIAPTNKLIK